MQLYFLLTSLSKNKTRQRITSLVRKKSRKPRTYTIWQLIIIKNKINGYSIKSKFNTLEFN